MQIKIIITTTSSFDTARDLGRRMLSQKLCACVNILPKCYSLYHWQNNIEETEEYMLLIKTSADKYDAVEKLIKTIHPYELPEIISLNVGDASSEYLNWIHSNVAGYTP